MGIAFVLIFRGGKDLGRIEKQGGLEDILLHK